MDYRELANELFECLINKPKCRPNNSVVEDVSHGEVGLIGFLSDKGDGVTSGYLSEKLGKTTARIANTLNSLEKKGLVRREMDSADRRKIIVFLTDKGKILAKQKRDEAVDDLTEKMKYLGESDAVEHIRIMKRLRQFDIERNENK